MKSRRPGICDESTPIVQSAGEIEDDADDDDDAEDSASGVCCCGEDDDVGEDKSTNEDCAEAIRRGTTADAAPPEFDSP